MSFTGFLFLIIVIVTIAQALKSLLNSRTARIWLISYREHLHQKEVEKEMQKTRQRTIEEIKNPDRILEIVMKMRRGEEVKIPLVAFDYIYRNMKKFSIVDKEGRIAIINHEDYFRFKEEALSLIESNKNNTMSAKQILEDLSKRVAENPIEITEYEDGTIVKVDHVARTAEVSKPNGEKFFIDHKTETMISQNLIETQEQKEQKAPRKDYKKDAELKQKTEEVKLLQSKVNRLEKEQPANSSHRKEKQSN